MTPLYTEISLKIWQCHYLTHQKTNIDDDLLRTRVYDMTGKEIFIRTYNLTYNPVLDNIARITTNMHKFEV